MSSARQQTESRKAMRIATGQQHEPRNNNNRKSLGQQFRQIVNGKVITNYTDAALRRKRIFVKTVYGVSL